MLAVMQLNLNIRLVQFDSILFSRCWAITRVRYLYIHFSEYVCTDTTLVMNLIRPPSGHRESLVIVPGMGRSIGLALG
jgi:hypothetical protein